MLQAGIEIQLILRQSDILPLIHQPSERKRREFNAYVQLLFSLHVYALQLLGDQFIRRASCYVMNIYIYKSRKKERKREREREREREKGVVREKENDI